ncbi:unnamed protein product [Staurois parvus]|uniref:Uncharacterized protein n=1 Tax=Staurois parvus TaxID=386267 RepID=A0ABN9F5I5_9NEOB|nr:unnamed protein product [Staurois parvus]
MRCPWYLSQAFLVWARTQGPHDPLLPRGPMSCQSAPGGEVHPFTSDGGIKSFSFIQPAGPGVSRGPHEMPLVPFS